VKYQGETPFNKKYALKKGRKGRQNNCCLETPPSSEKEEGKQRR
jgi:hypothetical protein